MFFTNVRRLGSLFPNTKVENINFILHAKNSEFLLI